MDCAVFEARLVELAAEEIDGAARIRAVRDLEAHAEECAPCADARELLAVLARPAADRDPIADPEESYWAEFEGRVRGRIVEAAASTRPASRRTWWAAAAAILALGILGAWWLRHEPSGVPRIAETTTGIDRSARSAGLRAEPLPEVLEQHLAAAPAHDVLAQVDALAGWGEASGPIDEDDVGGPWGAGGPFPDVSDLEDDAQRSLLRWLREQAS